MTTAEQNPVLKSERDPAMPLAELFTTLVKQTGRSPASVLSTFARLAIGPGRPSFPDYVKLRLFDEAFHAGSRLDTFCGQRRNMYLCFHINYRHDWFGLLANKISSLSYLAAYGFPTIPVAAIYDGQAATDKGDILPDRAALERFLTTPDNYPLFGKPVEGFQSLGSIGLKSCATGSRELERFDGTAVSLDSFMDEVCAGHQDGYVFQAFTAPHAAIRELCGPRLATVRMVTILSSDGPKIFRAAWKVPAGTNIADNFWRSGNLLAQIDVATGRVGRVLSGSGLTTIHHTHHPDTGAQMAGFEHPQWDAMCQLAVEGARLMRHVPMIGWDIALTQSGPMIVEMNETPDFFLVQFADGKGALDAEFNAFAAFQKGKAASHLKSVKAVNAKL